MMELAFPFLLLMLLMGPGFVFRAFSQRQEVRYSEQISLSRATFFAFIVACFANMAGVCVASLLGFDVRLGDVMMLLANEGQAVLLGLQKGLNDLAWPFIGFFLLTWAGAYVAAKLWFKLVSRCSWEHVGNPMSRHVRGEAPWYYLLNGLDYPESEHIEGAYVAATVDLGGQTYLYEGLLLDFQLGHDGALDRLVLIDAERRLLQDDRQGNEDDDNRFYNISGNYFILKYAQISTLNVSYLVAVAAP